MERCHTSYFLEGHLNGQSSEFAIALLRRMLRELSLRCRPRLPKPRRRSLTRRQQPGFERR